VERLLAEGREKIHQDPAQALPKALEALALARGLGRRTLEVDALVLQGQSLQNLGRYAEALDRLGEGRTLAVEAGYRAGEGKALMEQAKVYQRQGAPERSLPLEFQSLALAEKDGDAPRVMECLNIVGADQFHLLQFDAAARTWQRALDLAVQAGEVRMEAGLLNNLGILANKRKDYAEAERQFGKALVLWDRLGDRKGVADLHNNLGMTWQARGDYRQAEAFFLKALPTKESSGNLRSLAGTLHNLAELYWTWGRPDQGLPYLRRATALAEEIGAKDLLKSLYELEGEYAARTGDFQTAWKRQKRAAEIQDSVYSTETGARVAEANARYEATLREREIGILKRDRIISRRTRWFLLILAGAGAALAAALWNRYRLKVRSEREIGLRNERLEALALQKSQFMRIAAHDLRSPLSGIVLQAELMSESRSHGDMVQAFRQIGRSGEEMARVLGRYLDIEAIEAGQLRAAPTPVPAADAIAKVVARQQFRAGQKGISIEVAGDGPVGWVLADPDFLDQSLDNLISNALKFSPFGSHVTVRCTWEESSGLFEVCDQGPGLAPEDRNRLFTRFAQLSAKPTDGEKSLGLGLSITKHMVEAMGGTVGVDSPAGGGAVFWFRIPRFHVEHGVEEELEFLMS
jgi:signal transduction histidine kinase